jgi:xanthine dehydrogenase accessory factor
LIQSVGASGFPAQLFEDISSAHAAGESLSIATDLDSGQSAVGSTGGFINHYPPPRRLLIIGAVEIAQCLAPIAIAMGVEVTVIDPRARFLTEERFPGVVLDDRWPDDAVRALRPDARTAIVTLSHDPKIDDPALVAAFEGTAGYIGALGSHTSQKARRDRLLNAGVTPKSLSRLEGPAGVAINSISAPEIALSIAGGMIRALNQGLR